MNFGSLKNHTPPFNHYKVNSDGKINWHLWEIYLSSTCHVYRLKYGWIIYILTYPTNWQDLGCWKKAPPKKPRPSNIKTRWSWDIYISFSYIDLVLL